MIVYIFITFLFLKAIKIFFIFFNIRRSHVPEIDRKSTNYNMIYLILCNLTYSLPETASI